MNDNILDLLISVDSGYIKTIEDELLEAIERKDEKEIQSLTYHLNHCKENLAQQISMKRKLMDNKHEICINSVKGES